MTIGTREELVTCTTCRARFIVEYTVAPKPGDRFVSVACPHCEERQTAELSHGAYIYLARPLRAGETGNAA